MPRRALGVLLIVLVAATLSVPAGAAAPVAAALRQNFRPVIEKTPAGRIDWTRGLVTAVGTAKVQGKGAQAVTMAKRAARLLAARNAALLLAGVRAGPGGRFQNVQAGRIDTDALLVNFRQVHLTYDAKARTVTAKIVMPLHGARSVVTFTGVTYVKSDRRWDWPGGAGARDRADVVVLDARGTGFVPSIAPRVVDRLGRCLFEGGDLDPAHVRLRAIAAYVGYKQPAAATPLPKHASARAIAKAQARKAVALSAKLARDREEIVRRAEKRPRSPVKAPTGPKTLREAVCKRFRNPLILRAGATAKKSRDTLVLSPEAVQTLAEHPEARALLQSGKVVIVVR